MFKISVQKKIILLLGNNICFISFNKKKSYLFNKKKKNVLYVFTLLIHKNYMLYNEKKVSQNLVIYVLN